MIFAICLSMLMTSYLLVTTLPESYLLSSEFKLRDLGNAYYFLRVEVIPTSIGLMLSQHKYVLDILCRAGMSSYKLVNTPASVSKLDLSSTVLFLDPTRFRQIVSAF